MTRRKQLKATQKAQDVQPAWFAIYTKPRLEWLVDGLLRRAGYATLYLHYMDTVRHARKSVDVKRSYFPRYIFAAIGEGQSFYEVNHTTGVSTIVYADGEPLQVPLAVIEELAERGDKNGLIELSPIEKKERHRYKSGQAVRVNDGPFTGFIGAVSLDSGREVRIWLEMFKGRVTVGFAPEQVSPVGRRYTPNRRQH